VRLTMLHDPDAEQVPSNNLVEQRKQIRIEGIEEEPASHPVAGGDVLGQRSNSGVADRFGKQDGTAELIVANTGQ